MTWIVLVGVFIAFGLYDLSRVFWLIRDDLYDIRCSLNTVGAKADKLLRDELAKRSQT